MSNPEYAAFAADTDYAIELAAKLADEDDNLLLARQAIDLMRAGGSGVHLPEYVTSNLEHTRDRLEHAWREGRHLLWLDTPVAGEADMTDRERAAARLHRTIGWMEDIRNGDGYATYVTAPARNEEAEIVRFFESLRGHATEHPIIAVIIANNDSDDNTADRVRESNGNVFDSPVLGIGPSRQTALDVVGDHLVLPRHQSLVLITDSDVTVSPALTDVIVDEFADPWQQHKLVANGTVEYDFRWPDRPFLGSDGQLLPETSGGLELATAADIARVLARFADPEDPTMIRLKGFRGYSLFTGTNTIRDCFRQLGHDLSDYIVGDVCHMLPGPFTAMRMSLLDQFPWRFAADRRWEMHDFTINLHRYLDIAQSGMMIEGADRNAKVMASARSIVGDGGYDPEGTSVLSTPRLLQLWREGIQPYRSDSPGNKELGSIALTIADIHREVYGLDDAQTVHPYFRSELTSLMAATCGLHTGHESPRQALHAGTRRPLIGKMALIGTAR